MPPKIKGGKKGNTKCERNAAVSTTADNLASEKKRSMASSSAVTQIKTGSTENRESSVNTRPHMQAKDNKSTSVTRAAKQYDVDLAKNKDKIALSHCGENLFSPNREVTLSAEKSKRGRGRGKSAPCTSVRKADASAENEGHKLNSSDTFINSAEMQKLIAARISAIESGKAEAHTITEMLSCKIVSSPFKDEKRKTNFKTEDKHAQSFPTEKMVLVPIDENKAVKKGNPVPPRITLKVVKPAGNTQTSENPPKNEVEQEDKEDVEYATVINATEMQSKSEEIERNERTTGDNLVPVCQEEVLPAKKPKKKRRRKSRRKSAPNTLGTESLVITENEGNKFDCSDTLCDMDDDMMELINARISAIEAGLPELKDIKPKNKCKIKSSEPQELNRNVPYPTFDESMENFREKMLPILNDETDSTRPVIFVTDKSTQTVMFQESSNIPENISSIKHSELISDLDCTITAKATESDSFFPTEESILKNNSGDIDIRAKFGSKSSSSYQDLKRISEEFLKDLKITSEKLEDGFAKSLKREK